MAEKTTAQFKPLIFETPEGEALAARGSVANVPEQHQARAILIPFLFEVQVNPYMRGEIAGVTEERAELLEKPIHTIPDPQSPGNVKKGRCGRRLTEDEIQQVKDRNQLYQEAVYGEANRTQAERAKQAQAATQAQEGGVLAEAKKTARAGK